VTPSEANLETVRRAYEAFNRGDLVAFLAELDDEVHVDMTERVFNPDTYDGHEGVRRFYAEVREVWEDFRWDPEEIVGAGDKVAALVHSHGRGKGSGVKVDRRIGFVWTLRAGRATSIRLYVDQAKALEVAGASRRA